jgi:hypothetical protein
MKFSTNSIAGLLFLFPVLGVFGIWYIILFMDNPTCVNSLESFRYFLTEPPHSMLFRWLLVLPILSLTFSGLHFSRIAQSRLGSIGLFSLGVLLAIATWLTVQVIAILVTLPLIYSFKNMREHLTRRSSGMPQKRGAP